MWSNNTQSLPIRHIGSNFQAFFTYKQRKAVSMLSYFQAIGNLYDIKWSFWISLTVWIVLNSSCGIKKVERGFVFLNFCCFSQIYNACIPILLSQKSVCFAASRAPLKCYRKPPKKNFFSRTYVPFWRMYHSILILSSLPRSIFYKQTLAFWKLFILGSFRSIKFFLPYIPSN
jgi:hypothetical protein